MLNPAIPTLFSLVQEVPNAGRMGLNELLQNEDFRADWKANIYGQQNAWRIWMSPTEICDSVPGAR
jgi:hypothetical protein